MQFEWHLLLDNLPCQGLFADYEPPGMSDGDDTRLIRQPPVLFVDLCSDEAPVSPRVVVSEPLSLILRELGASLSSAPPARATITGSAPCAVARPPSPNADWDLLTIAAAQGASASASASSFEESLSARLQRQRAQVSSAAAAGQGRLSGQR